MSKGKKEEKITRRGFLKVTEAVVAATVGGSFLAACAETATPTPLAGGPAPAVLKGASLTYLHYGWFVPKMNDTIRDFAIDWASQNNVKFNIESVSTADVGTRLASTIETKSGPNLAALLASPASISEALVDITDIAEELADLQDGWYLPASYSCVVDEKWLSIPYGAWAGVINWRPDWFAEVGYDVFPDTWEECYKAGKKLNAAGHPYGWAFTGAGGDGEQHSLPVLWSFGGKVFNSDGTIALDSAETLEALEFAIRFYEDTCDPGVTAWSNTSNNQAFLAEQISMTLNVDTIYLPARDSNPELAAAMDHALPPKGTAGRFIYELVPSMCLLNHTTGIDLDAAKEFMRDFYNPQQYAQFIKDGEGYVIPLAPLYEDLPVWPTDPKLAIIREAPSIGRPSGYDLPSQNKVSGLMDGQHTIGKMFASACTSGDARAALDDALIEIEDLQKI